MEQFPTPVLKCTKTTTSESAVVLSFKQAIGATSKLPHEFTIAISKEDMKKIIDDITDDPIDLSSFDTLL